MEYLSSKCYSLFRRWVPRAEREIALDNEIKGAGERQVCWAKQVIALDAELVGSGHKGSISMLARVSLVFQNGYVYDKYVKPTQPVTDYRTPWSGIHEEDLRTADDYQKIRSEVEHIIQDCILVGHDLRNDLGSLRLTHPSRDIRDTALYLPFRKSVVLNHILTQRRVTRNNSTYYDPLIYFEADKIMREKQSLRTLARVILKRHIQNGDHSSVEDARAALDLYLKVASQWEAELV